jgi:hypothetical protein
VIALWQAVNAIVAGAALAWLIVVYRERKAQHDYLSGASLAVGCGLYAVAAFVGSVYSYHTKSGFRPSMPFITVGGIAVLIGSFRSIRGLESTNRRRRRRRRTRRR